MKILLILSLTIAASPAWCTFESEIGAIKPQVAMSAQALAQERVSKAQDFVFPALEITFGLSLGDPYRTRHMSVVHALEILAYSTHKYRGGLSENAGYRVAYYSSERTGMSQFRPITISKKELERKSGFNRGFGIRDKWQAVPAVLRFYVTDGYGDDDYFDVSIDVILSAGDQELKTRSQLIRPIVSKMDSTRYDMSIPLEVKINILADKITLDIAPNWER